MIKRCNKQIKPCENAGNAPSFPSPAGRPEWSNEFSAVKKRNLHLSNHHLQSHLMVNLNNPIIPIKSSIPTPKQFPYPFSHPPCPPLLPAFLLPISLSIHNNKTVSMGSLSSKTIRVATANYSGITFSPFEFYSDEQAQLQQLNEIFSTLFSQINPSRPQLHSPLAELTNYNKLEGNRNGGKDISNSFNWKINTIDKSMHRGRYCAQYREDAGIENGRLVTMSKYFQRWEFEFNKNVKYVKMEKPDLSKELPIEDQKRVCQVFDFLIYKTFIEYCYQLVFKEQGMGNTNPNVTIEDRDTDDSKESRTRRKHALLKYEQFQQKYHKKPYLKTDIKFSYIKQLYSNNDVVFLQDCSDELINEIKNEGDITIIRELKGGADCCILINSNGGGFHRLYDLNRLMQQQKQQLAEHPQLAPTLLFRSDKFNYHKSSPAICLTDQFLLMSLHFSSRSENKYRQLVCFMAHALQINKKYEGKLKIIVGGDFNTNIRSFTKDEEYLKQHRNDLQAHETLCKQFWRVFSLYPDNLNAPTITTRKKRTYLQSQAKKALAKDENSRDFLLSNCPLTKGKLINNSTSLMNYLPTATHPFDHFFISAEIAKQ